MALVTVSGGDTVDSVVIDVANVNPPTEASAHLDDVRAYLSFVEQAQNPKFSAEDRAAVRADIERALGESIPAWETIDGILRNTEWRDEVKPQKASEANQPIEAAAAKLAEHVDAERQKLAEWEARAPRLVPNPDGVGYRVGPERRVDLSPAEAIELRHELRKLGDPSLIRAALVAAARDGNHELLHAARSMNRAFPVADAETWRQVDDTLLQSSPAFSAIESARIALAMRESVLRALQGVAARFRGPR